jgi:hypothetical protein
VAALPHSLLRSPYLPPASIARTTAARFGAASRVPSPRKNGACASAWHCRIRTGHDPRSAVTNETDNVRWLRGSVSLGFGEADPFAITDQLCRDGGASPAGARASVSRDMAAGPRLRRPAVAGSRVFLDVRRGMVRQRHAQRTAPERSGSAVAAVDDRWRVLQSRNLERLAAPVRTMPFILPPPRVALLLRRHRDPPASTPPARSRADPARSGVARGETRVDEEQGPPGRPKHSRFARSGGTRGRGGRCRNPYSSKTVTRDARFRIVGINIVRSQMSPRRGYDRVCAADGSAPVCRD